MGKLLQAAGAAFLLFAVTSFIFYELIMVEQFAVWEAEVARSEPLLASGVIAIALLSLAMAYIYPMVYAGGAPIREGARFGLAIGAVVASMMLIVYSVYDLALAGTLTDIVFNVALLAAIGATIGIVYGQREPHFG